MNKPLRVAVVGLGRIGRYHAQHVRELEGDVGDCRLVALVDPQLDRANETARVLELDQSVATFASIDQLLESGASDVAVVCSSTSYHRQNAEQLIRAGHRVLVEKPLTGSLSEDREFAELLNKRYPDGLMLAFQRRFDEALNRAKLLLDQGTIGEPFKIYSALEDSGPPPDGYQSPGLLQDMSVHNMDEIVWLTGQRPTAVRGFGSRLYNHEVASVDEDFDDVLLQMWFDSSMIGQVQVSRNHVSGYRVETVIYGQEGLIRVGSFKQDAREVQLQAYGKTNVIEDRAFTSRDYGHAVPEFIDRFGLAYKAELAHFVRCCLEDEPFGVNQQDGLRAMELASAGQQSLMEKNAAVSVQYRR